MSTYAEERLAEIKGPPAPKAEPVAPKPRVKLLNAKARKRALRIVGEALAAIQVNRVKLARALDALGLQVKWADETDIEVPK